MLQEHWLSPFVLGRPDPAFEGVQRHAVSHSTLNEISVQTKGCSGIAIIYKIF